MAIGIILGIILFIAAIGAFIWCGYCANNGNGVGAGITGVIGALLVVAFIIVPFSFHTVNTGELAVFWKAVVWGPLEVCALEVAKDEVVLLELF